jgi:PhnB protein
MSAPEPAARPPAAQVVAELSVRRGQEAVAFYQAAFGAVEQYRVGGDSNNEAVVSQLAIGGAPFWVADESPEHLNFSPESVGGSTTRLLLMVEDPEAVVRRAVAAGATEVRPVAQEHGWLLGRIADPYGHHWEVGRPLSEWPPPSGRPHHQAPAADAPAAEAPAPGGAPPEDEPNPVLRPNGLTYVRIPAPDPQRSAAFYGAVFAWEIRDGQDPAFSDGTGHVIGHFRADLPVAGEAGVWPYLFVEDLDATLARAVEAGATVHRAPYPEGNLWVATIWDPAGNVIGLWQAGPRRGAPT